MRTVAASGVGQTRQPDGVLVVVVVVAAARGAREKKKRGDIERESECVRE